MESVDKEYIMVNFVIDNGQLKRYNACTDPCDVYNGSCACGAWHSPDEPSGYKNLTMQEIFDVVVDEEAD